jgi:hypothetical protein
MSSMYEWCHAFQTLSNQIDEQHEPLFLAFLLRCEDESQGCVLISGFEHALGDAASYALFVKAWSDKYEHLNNRLRKIQPVPRTIPHGAYHDSAMDIPCPAGSLMPRRYILTPAALASFKAQLGSTGSTLSSNDILMAQCACALAPHRRPLAPHGAEARVSMLIDRRGRGWDADRFGNGVVHTSFALPWDLLLAGAVAAAAALASARVRAALCALQDDPEAFHASTRRAAAAPKLFVWNSWARAGRVLRGAAFGDPAGPRRVEWLNALALSDPSVVLVTAAPPPPGAPPSSPDALAVQLSFTCAAEAEALDAVWGGGGCEAVERLRCVKLA